MNFAAIGLGSFGQKRAKAIKDSEQGKLVAIFDTNKDIANKASKDLEVPVKDYKDILKDSTVDVIAICTPNKFHKDIIIDALGALSVIIILYLKNTKNVRRS